MVIGTLLESDEIPELSPNGTPMRAMSIGLCRLLVLASGTPRGTSGRQEPEAIDQAKVHRDANSEAQRIARGNGIRSVTAPAQTIVRAAFRDITPATFEISPQR
jgi:hypothetical protein